ncbi:lipase maturation factor family protein [Quadrisphaera sp. DSM 44207]|uniref:lipase maturation factor family protein n=1 Tax=Quadrisphaera sp. DSM 44207 TaxID=1881057 RepID=UPI0008879D5D|nr:lipase maturation factor family protein [Quadrisphaera sp. DSM 44207]SDQ35574.1 Lipase maturation factor [Quadrisphaera sp. DSM 44207]
MDWLSDPGYWHSRLVFTRALALIYLVAFTVALTQFRPLLGERGLTPIPRFLARVPFRRSPSLFSWRYSDRLFAGVCWVGIALSALTLVGVPDRLPLAGWMLVWFALWALYLSIVNVGQTWYGFGWETLLLEAGFLAIFLGPAHVAPPVLVLWLLRWLLFRLEFGAGLIKMRGDRCWRDLTCLEHHHETQPMPGPLSWYFHHLPKPLHKVEVVVNHAMQLVLVFGLLLPQPVASVAALLVIITQGYLVVSGNFSWLNALTLVLAIPVLDGRWLDAVVPVDPPTDLSSPAWHQVLTIALTALVAVLSVGPVRNLLSKRQAMNASFEPLHLVNTYGAFGSITRVRHEVVLSGTDDPAPGPETVWREYEFKAKPGDVHRRPPQIAPYHLRLDWLMWFVAINPGYGDRWLVPLLVRLLEGDRATLKLLRSSPFPPQAPPRWVRASVYRYRYTTPAERRATGAWWTRRHVNDLVRPMSLESSPSRAR